MFALDQEYTEEPEDTVYANGSLVCSWINQECGDAENSCSEAAVRQDILQELHPIELQKG